MRPPLPVAVVGLVLTAVVWKYFDAAGYPLTGPSIVVAMAICVGVAWSGKLIWTYLRGWRDRYAKKGS